MLHQHDRLLWPAVLVLSALMSPSAAADEAASQPGLKLFRPDSLAGWDHDPTEPQGWTMSDGQLSAASDSSTLLSGWTFGDFELRFHWAVSDSGQIDVRFPRVPSGDGPTITLDSALAASTNSDGKGDRFNTAVIRRTGHQMLVEVNDHKVDELELRSEDARLGLALAVTRGEAKVAEMRLQEPVGSPLYNGQDLTGWWTPGDKTAWSPIGDEIVLTGPNGNYLRTEKEYGNFTLSFQYKIKKGGNSGIGIRTARNGWPSGDGMELQLLDRPGLVKDSTMAIYGNLTPLARNDRSEVWNDVVIKADGRMITAWVNGELVQHTNTARLPELKHRHLKGWIGLQDHGNEVHFRNLRLLEAPDGIGLDAWYEQPQESAAVLVLDRLMNSMRLAEADDIRSGVATATVSGEGEHVLAELTGPGAVVHLYRSHASGRIAFYFDGEHKPRIECGVDKLFDQLPKVAEDKNPLLTYLPYQKSLKIVLEKPGREVEWRIEHVQFPERMPVQPFESAAAAIPPTYSGALVYRFEQFGWGTHREHDPMPRAELKQSAIQPGQRKQLNVPGSGVIQWTKLRGDKKLLSSQDLWLEVSADGSQQPLLSAPASFFFTPFKDNYRNYVILDRGGVTSLLAMPFSQGISLALVNHSDKPLSAGLIVSYLELPEDHTEKLMRLHGQFTAVGNNPSGSLFNRQGNGRWIGLVCRTSGDDFSDIAALTVDGEAQAAWTSTSLTEFFGQTSSEGEARQALSGHRNDIFWRYLLLAPVDFSRSIEMQLNGKVGDCLALFYLER